MCIEEQSVHRVGREGKSEKGRVEGYGWEARDGKKGARRGNMEDKQVY